PLPRRGQCRPHGSRLERGRPPDRQGVTGGGRRARPPRPTLPGLLMTRVLHLLKGDDAELMLSVIASQHAAGDEVTVVRLPGAPTITAPIGVTVERVPEDLTYKALLQQIFAADQVITW